MEAIAASLIIPQILGIVSQYIRQEASVLRHSWKVAGDDNRRVVRTSIGKWRGDSPGLPSDRRPEAWR